MDEIVLDFAASLHPPTNYGPYWTCLLALGVYRDPACLKNQSSYQLELLEHEFDHWVAPNRILNILVALLLGRALPLRAAGHTIVAKGAKRMQEATSRAFFASKRAICSVCTTLYAGIPRSAAGMLATKPAGLAGSTGFSEIMLIRDLICCRAVAEAVLPVLLSGPKW